MKSIVITILIILGTSACGLDYVAKQKIDKLRGKPVERPASDKNINFHLSYGHKGVAVGAVLVPVRVTDACFSRIKCSYCCTKQNPKIIDIKIFDSKKLKIINASTGLIQTLAAGKHKFTVFANNGFKTQSNSFTIDVYEPNQVNAKVKCDGVYLENSKIEFYFSVFYNKIRLYPPGKLPLTVKNGTIINHVIETGKKRTPVVIHNKSNGKEIFRSELIGINDVERLDIQLRDKAYTVGPLAGYHVFPKYKNKNVCLKTDYKIEVLTPDICSLDHRSQINTARVKKSSLHHIVGKKPGKCLVKTTELTTGLSAQANIVFIPKK